MAGIILPYLPMTEFNFSFLNASTNKIVVINPAINVVGYYYARLIIRIHEIDIATGVGSPNIEVGAYSTDPSPEDPRDFAITATSTLFGLVNTQAVGALVTDTDTDLYPFLKMYVKGNQGTSNGTRLFAVLSADLILREA